MSTTNKLVKQTATTVEHATCHRPTGKAKRKAWNPATLSANIDALMAVCRDNPDQQRTDQIRGIMAVRDTLVDALPDNQVFTKEEVVQYIDQTVIRVSSVLGFEEELFSDINT